MQAKIKLGTEKNQYSHVLGKIPIATRRKGATANRTKMLSIIQGLGSEIDKPIMQCHIWQQTPGHRVAPDDVGCLAASRRRTNWEERQGKWQEQRLSTLVLSYDSFFKTLQTVLSLLNDLHITSQLIVAENRKKRPHIKPLNRSRLV
jgi:hypothetical protein